MREALCGVVAAQGIDARVIKIPWNILGAEGAILKLFILASTVCVGAIVWDRTKDPARAIAYGAAVALVILAFIFFLMLLSAG